MRSFRLFSRTLLVVFLLVIPFGGALRASDHADAPGNADDRGTDLADSYFFVDPNDNTRVVMIMTFAGFIVPGENSNLGLFSEDGAARFNFEIENTGDAVSDRIYRVTFGAKPGPAGPQTATIELPDGRTFTAPTTAVSHTADTAPTAVITTDAISGVTFWAGLADDPFFFDIPAFGRFVASVRAGSPNVAVFERGRDTFAGYNILSIALSVPAASLRGTNGNIVGLSISAQRRLVQLIGANGKIAGSGRYVNADRFGVPGINTVVIPYARKNEYNNSNPAQDAAGRFAADIVATLQSLGTNATNIGILADVAVAKGDIMRLDTSKANTGPGGGNTAGSGFPNGRRPADDVIDTLLFFVANQNVIKDNVNANDVAFRDTFPFVAPPHQPLPAGATDNTRN